MICGFIPRYIVLNISSLVEMLLYLVCYSNPTRLQQKYDILEAAKLWTLKVIQGARRTYQTCLKEKYYLPNANNELQMAKRPSFVSQSEFKDHFEY